MSEKTSLAPERGQNPQPDPGMKGGEGAHAWGALGRSRPGPAHTGSARAARGTPPLPGLWKEQAPRQNMPQGQGMGSLFKSPNQPPQNFLRTLLRGSANDQDTGWSHPRPVGSRGRDINSLPFLLQVSLFK